MKKQRIESPANEFMSGLSKAAEDTITAYEDRPCETCGEFAISVLNANGDMARQHGSWRGGETGGPECDNFCTRLGDSSPKAEPEPQFDFMKELRKL